MHAHRSGLLGAALVAILANCTLARAQTQAQPTPLTVYVSIGDSITEFGSASSADKRFASIVSHTLGGLDANLATHTMTVDSLMTHEVPRIPPQATIVFVYIGRNDENNQRTETAAQWDDDYDELITAVRQHAPKARIVLATIPASSYLPHGPYGKYDLQTRRRLQAFSLAINAHVIAYAAKPGFAVVDLRCDPEQYDPAMTTDGVHHNDLGHAETARRILDVIQPAQPPVPKRACPPYTDAE